MSPHPRNNHKRPFVDETRPSVIKISLKETSKPSSDSNSSLCLKGPSHLSLCQKGPSQVKGKRSARQSKPPTKRLIATNDNDVSYHDAEVTPVHVHPKRKSTKSASGDGDVPLVKKPRKSKVMNKKERHSLTHSPLRTPYIWHPGVITHPEINLLIWLQVLLCALPSSVLLVERSRL